MFSKDNRKKRILVIDDDPLTRGVICDVLKEADYEVVESSGFLSTDIIAKKAPDLIIMDIMMPGKSGYDATREIRADPEFKHIPIVMCTAKDMLGDVGVGLAVGANDYISKPFSPDRLLAKVGKLLAAVS